MTVDNKTNLKNQVRALDGSNGSKTISDGPTVTHLMSIFKEGVKDNLFSSFWGSHEQLLIMEIKEIITECADTTCYFKAEVKKNLDGVPFVIIGHYSSIVGNRRDGRYYACP